MHDLSRRRTYLCVAFVILALGAAAMVALSAAMLDRRLVDDRVEDQLGAIASDIEHRAAAGAPIRDYTGFHAAAAAAVAAEETLRAVRIFAANADAPLFEVEEAAKAGAAEERRLTIAILSRSAAREALGPVGRIEAALHARTWGERVGELPLLIVAATLVLILIGVIYFAAVAEDFSVAGRMAAVAWFFAALAPAAAMCVWLLSASAESYRQTATVAADIAADRLRPAVALNLDIAQFQGLEAIFPEAEMAEDALAPPPNIAFALVEGPAALTRAGGVVQGFWADWPWALSVVRAVRPLSLAAPALTVTARLSWFDIARRALWDHPYAIAAVLYFVFGPALTIAFFGRIKA